jgi:hypothetical protein
VQERAVRFAQQVNLHADDVPGMNSGGGEHERPTSPHGAPSCGKDLVPEKSFVVNRASTSFTAAIRPHLHSGEPVFVESTVRVLHSAREAANANRALTNPRTIRCAVEAVKLASHEGRARVTPARVHRPVPSLPGSTAFRQRIDQPTRRLLPVSYNDQLGFVVGSAKITLFVSSTGLPPSTSTERPLLLLLYHRAMSREARALLPQG